MAIIVYLALTVKVWLIWESDDVGQFDYLETDKNFEEQDMEDSKIESHGAGSSYMKVCSMYKTICNKISWAWNFTDEDKTQKFAYIVYLLKNLDTNIKRGNIPSKALLAMLVNKKDWARRWSANWTTVTINLWWMKYDNEFFQVISHEIWHIIDLWWLQWTSSKKSQIFTEFDKPVFSIDDPSLEYYKYSRVSEKVRKWWMSREDFCSWYGMSDPFEDFAECHNLYLNHHDYFHKLALANNTVKDKYNFFSNLYGWKYINNSEAKYENWGNSYRVWDTTKIREW